jgi:hypothetical protein
MFTPETFPLFAEKANLSWGFSEENSWGMVWYGGEHSPLFDN